MSSLEVIFQTVNEHIGLNILKVNFFIKLDLFNGLNFICIFFILFKAQDIGKSIYVHVFGAYFGLAIARSMQDNRTIKNDKQISDRNSNMFSLIGF